jgi:Protein of unknown function (DUF1236)
MRKTWTTSLLALTAATALAGAITAASAQGMGGHHMGGSAGGGGFAAPHGGGGYAGPHGGGRGPVMNGGGGFAGPHGGSNRGPSFGGGAPHAQRSFGPQATMRGEFGSRAHGMQTGGLHERGLSSQGGMHAQSLANERNLHGQNLRTTTRTGFAQAGVHSHIPLSHTKINRIRQVALHNHFFSRVRVTNVNFDIAIGVHVPRHFHLFLVPEEIVFIEPAFSGFLCFFFEDEFVIVDPVTFVIVAIIPV